MLEICSGRTTSNVVPTPGALVHESPLPPLARTTASTIGEPQPAATPGPRSGRVRAVEPLEHPRDLLRAAARAHRPRRSGRTARRCAPARRGQVFRPACAPERCREGCPAPAGPGPRRPSTSTGLVRTGVVDRPLAGRAPGHRPPHRRPARPRSTVRPQAGAAGRGRPSRSRSSTSPAMRVASASMRPIARCSAASSASAPLRASSA